ncbi:DEAD/DEAH box helicase [Herbivorax sp. ANBcel31]|uniref:DEAD/DEAH box helicase n=1 Tax=Herbivorax sp. ANBcel31 TaxID=3069754 RepID=UPI0027B3802A|nr:DEAD/DEAH box helicase [Herbivorax sp. ANBcel31]MDQ2086852.1 DEAD/DEAH box helicase [Herbivorax sp. ANBcel31]
MNNLTFNELNLSFQLQKAIEDMGFEETTPIQSLTINHILNGRDVIGQAQTGTGKTCAFGIPAIEMLNSDTEDPQVLILCPTRELAIQVSKELKSVSKYKEKVRILPIYGGQPINRQISALKRRPQIIIGTPGRIMDHLRRNTLKLMNIKMMILDEADEMLNMGFREDIDTILQKIPSKRQTIFFSATMPKEILDLTKKYQIDPIHAKSAHKEITVPAIEQFYLEVSSTAKLEVLSRLLDVNDIKLSLIFCNTKKMVDELTGSLQSRGYSAEALHGDMKQEQRDRVMSKFRKGLIDTLIATDVAARGIDVDDVEAVINYDIPNDEEYYVHRIGRTGRAGKAGKAFTLVVGREIHKLKEIQRYTKSYIKLIKPPSLMDVEERKIGNTLNKIEETLNDGSFSKYVPYIESVLDDSNSVKSSDNYVTTLEIAAALLKIMFYKDNPQDICEKPTKDTNVPDGMVRLYMDIGRNNKVQPRHIVESIASSTGLPGKLIGAINIFDKFSFVDVPGKYVPQVLKSMKDNTVKGRKVVIQKSHKKRKRQRRL